MNRFEKNSWIICFIKKSSNFAAENLVLRASRRDVSQIKRESGENPEQTRCCKSHQVVTQTESLSAKDGKAV